MSESSNTKAIREQTMNLCRLAERTDDMMVGMLACAVLLISHRLSELTAELKKLNDR